MLIPHWILPFAEALLIRLWKKLFHLSIIMMANHQQRLPFLVFLLVLGVVCELIFLWIITESSPDWRLGWHFFYQCGHRDTTGNNWIVVPPLPTEVVTMPARPYLKYVHYRHDGWSSFYRQLFSIIEDTEWLRGVVSEMKFEKNYFRVAIDNTLITASSFVFCK